MNMYAVVYNEFVKDLIIANDEQNARDVMKEFNESVVLGAVDPSAYDTLPVILVPDDLMFMTTKGLVSVRQVINANKEPRYWTAVDNKMMQFL